MTSPATLADESRTLLLEIARSAVSAAVCGGRAAVPAAALPPASGVFVTVRIAGELRGCLGTLEAPIDLAGEVARCAADAATRDPRFPPVIAEELTTLDVEVSVLGPFEPIDPEAPGSIQVGRHGLLVEHGRRRGLLLPQVAIEWGWTIEQFVRQTCVKAGLAPDAWRHGASVSRFEADVFGG